MWKLSKVIVLSKKSEIRQPNGGPLSLYINNKLKRPLNTLEASIASKIEKLELENDELKKKMQ